MTLSDVILQERHRDAVQALLTQSDDSESAAYMLFGKSEIGQDPWDHNSRIRYTSFEVISIPAEDRISASNEHVTWSTQSFVRLIRRAKEENLVPAIVHSHPTGFDGFSEQDVRNERNLFTLVRNRNGEKTRLLSIVQVGSDIYRAQVWQDDKSPQFCHQVSCIGSNLVVQSIGDPTPNETLSRQALGFGEEVNTRLQNLRIAVVGCGGTGSPVVHLLARLGVRRILVIDDDIVELSNLNRLHGATREDAENGVAKTDVMVRTVTGMGLGTEIRALQGWVDSPDARDALRSCDVIFGCTDDHAGRAFLNRLSYFYLIPVIDVGLVLLPNQAGKKGLQEMAARVSVLFPSFPCLICRGNVDLERARGEDLWRRNPVEYERQKEEAYVIGGGNPAPAVVTFTTEAATMAVNELLQGLIDYRGDGTWALQRYRKLDRGMERTLKVAAHPECPICSDQSNWGRGDVEPFLDRVG